MAATTNDNAIAGPAKFAAATPVSEKIPAPMMAPMPSATSCPAPSERRRLSFSASARITDSGLIHRRLINY